MEPVNTEVFDHEQTEKLGILLVNLGTPTAPTASALRPFLKEFLSDRRVVDLPRALWWPILNGIILNTRPRKSAKAYQEIWSERGSPLLVHTVDQVAALREVMGARLGEKVMVDYAFRYGQPSIDNKIKAMLDAGVRKLLLIPLFPHYSGATTGSVFDALSSSLQKQRWVPEVRFVNHYHDHPRFISALATSVRAHWEEYGRADKLLLSYHGIPERYRDEGDPYYCECLKTSRLLAQELGLSEGEYATAFQSRFGREEWIKPYTDELLIEWALEGVDSVQVICPGFASDCLETLEEIGIQYRSLFINRGGLKCEYIPALNSGPGQIELLTALVRDNLQGWLH